MVENSDNIAASEQYQDFEKRHNRLLNMVADTVRLMVILISLK